MGKPNSFYACLFMGLFTTLLWVIPLLVLRFVYFPNFQAALIVVVCWCIALNITTLIVNFIDKRRATGDCDGNRIRENILFLLTLLGAGPATVLAMIIFNHKSSKQKYHTVFLCMAFLSILFIGAAFGIAYGVESLSKTEMWFLQCKSFSSLKAFYEHSKSEFNSSILHL